MVTDREVPGPLSCLGTVGSAALEPLSERVQQAAHALLAPGRQANTRSGETSYLRSTTKVACSTDRPLHRAQQYLEAGLLDELELHVVPVLLGDGARLFDNLGDAEVQLEQVRAVEAPGVTHLKYRVVT